MTPRAATSTTSSHCLHQQRQHEQHHHHHHHHHDQQQHPKTEYHFCLQHKFSLLIALQLAILLSSATQILANPRPEPVAISNPEITSKSGKINSVSSPSSATLVIKASPQDAQLNSLSVYATNYDSISPISSSAASQSQSQSQLQSSNFKPSYKLPDMESNFTPIQTITGGGMHHSQAQHQLPSAAALTASATPVLMQYLPAPALSDGSAGNGNGVQYLQLIPTRPLIVPISPYLTANAAANAAQQPNNHAAFHPPLAAAANVGAGVDYAVRSPTVLTPMPANSGNLPSPFQHLLNIQGPAPYGLHTYASNIQPFRSGYRINREVKGKPFGGSLSLNMNEYIPTPNEPMRAMVFMRGRP